MTDISGIFNFASIASSVAFSSMGVAIGTSIASVAATKAIYIQPNAKGYILRASILGMALTETAAIIGLVFSIILLIGKDISVVNKFYWGLSNLGTGIAISISGFVIGIVSSFPVKYACLSIARQPFFSNKILNLMMLTLSFIQTPIIFGFVISLIINYQSTTANSIVDSLRHIGSGLSIGLGSIGPAVGLALFSKSACQAVGFNRHAYNKILTFTFISQALIETPVVFALVTSLLLLSLGAAQSPLSGFAMILAAFCTGISNISPGINSGRIAAAACKQISENPDVYIPVSRTSMLGQGLIDSFSIYGWLVSLLLIFFIR